MFVYAYTYHQHCLDCRWGDGKQNVGVYFPSVFDELNRTEVGNVWEKHSPFSTKLKFKHLMVCLGIRISFKMEELEQIKCLASLRIWI